MNNNIQQLYTIANKEERIIVGLMSGTSLDGLDIAVCSCKGAGVDNCLKLLEFNTIPYSVAFRTELRKLFSKKQIDLEHLCLMNVWIAAQHAQMVNAGLKKWNIPNSEIDIIASHGQTIYHAPKRLHQQQAFGNATLQIGDGDHLAVHTGILTISDFRQKHIAAGGEGAPLAAYGDFLLFGSTSENRIMLNIGGISNFTYLPKNAKWEDVLSSDTGPGNTIMDMYMQQHFDGKLYDADASIAKQGLIHLPLLKALKGHSFFDAALPKTTGQELFNLEYLERAKLHSDALNISHFDTMATLNRFTAETIAANIQQKINQEQYHIYSSGGGMHNPLLMRHLKELIPNCILKDTSVFNINPDAKEAVLFALLANESVAGNHSSVINKDSCMPYISMGKLSFPK